jgi:hypothetical protein
VRLVAALCVLVGCSPPAPAVPDAGPDATEEPGATGDDAGFGCLVCSDASEELPDWVAVRDNIDRICSDTDNCHGSAAGGMGLSPGHEFDTMINVTSTENPPMKRVLPGDPEHSYVYLKVLCDGGIVGACMPNGVSDDPVARLFHDWIEAGARTQ